MKRFFILLLALLPELVAWIRRTAPQAQVIFHQTWAYSQTSTHQEFPNYDSDQITMYYAIQDGEHHAKAKLAVAAAVHGPLPFAIFQ